jgi:chromosome segregation ATPase
MGRVSLLFRASALLMKPRYFNTNSSILRSSENPRSFTAVFQDLKNALGKSSTIVKSAGEKISKIAAEDMTKVEQVCSEVGAGMDVVAKTLTEHKVQLIEEKDSNGNPTLKARADSLEKRVTNLDIQTTEEKDAQGNDTLKTRVGKFEETVKTIESSTTNTIKELEGRVGVVEKRANSLGEKIDDCEETTVELEERVESIDKKTESLEERVADAEKTTFNLELQYTHNRDRQGQPTLKEKITFLQRDVNQLNVQATEDEDELSRPTLKTKVSRLQQTVSELGKFTEKTEKLEKEIIKLEGRYSGLNIKFWILVAAIIMFEIYQKATGKDISDIKEAIQEEIVMGIRQIFLAIGLSEDEIKRKAEKLYPVLGMTEEGIKRKLEEWFPVLTEKSVRKGLIIDQITQEIQKLQAKYNDSLSGSWFLSFASRGYSHQLKIKALVALEQEILALASHDYDEITANDISEKIKNQLKYAYNSSLEREDEDFRTVLTNNVNQLSM